MKSLPVYVSGIKVRNLKNVSIHFNSEEIVLLTGVSGSGKSSIAFDTLYAAGRKRYISTLPTFFATTITTLPNPKVEEIHGLSPTIAIKQNHFSHYSHATVGSTTELFSHLALLFTLEGQARDPKTKEVLDLYSKEKVLSTIMELSEGVQISILAPLLRKDIAAIHEYAQQGFTKVRCNGTIHPIYSFLTSGIPEDCSVDIVIDTLIKSENNIARLKVSLFTALEFGEGHCSVLSDEELMTFSTKQQIDDVTYTPLTQQLFSPHALESRCSLCQGSGIFISIDNPLLIDENLSIKENCCSFAGNCSSYLYHTIYQALADALNFNLETPWKDLSPEIQNIFLRGKNNLVLPVRLFDQTLGKKNLTYKVWRGVLNDIGDKVRYTTKPSRYLSKGMSAHSCSLCKGTGLGDYASVATWEGKTFTEFQQMSLNNWHVFFSKVKSPSLSIQEILQGLKQRLSFLIDLGLGYLTPNRALATLSGGEQERTAIAKHLGGELFGITYILDEPSIGLHPQDTEKLIGVIKKLRDQGNTVILVEHEERMISLADRIIDIGPGAGIFGGEVLFNGKPEDFLMNSSSLTAKYLRQELTIPIPESREAPTSWLLLTEATIHNLKNLSIRLPLARLIGVTGVSGSGKSSLINNTLVPAIESFLKQENPKNLHFEWGCIGRLIHITRDLPGRSQRSIPLTYIKAFDDIRELFASQPRSLRQGLTKAHFSFNQPQGACIQCQGLGTMTISDDDTPIPCSECQGKRYHSEVLEILYEGKNIADILDMTAYEAEKFFISHPKIHEKIHALCSLRLDYLPLGRPLSTLSGGEIQRLKLAHELLFASPKQTLYVLDEPTTGLHTHDIQALIEVLLSLTYLGHTVLVIEHNMHVVKVCDYVLELGPEGGDLGGYLLASCTPKDLIQLNTPTAKALAPYIEGSLDIPVVKSEPPSSPKSCDILIKDAYQNNLKHIDLALPRNSLIAIAGPGASGKHSLVFDILYASGNIAYAELFPPYIRQGLLKETPLPSVGEVKGLSPVISVRKCSSSNRSYHTIASALGLSNGLEKLFAILGEPFSPLTEEKLSKTTPQTIIDSLLKSYKDDYVTITSPIPLGSDLEIFLQEKQKEGFIKLYSEGNLYDLDERLPLNLIEPAIVIQHTKVSPKNSSSLLSAISVAFSLSSEIWIYISQKKQRKLSYSLGWKDKKGRLYPEITHQLLSSDHPEGRCLTCGGRGEILKISLEEHKEKIAHYTPLEFFSLFFPKSYMKPVQKLLKDENASQPLKLLTTKEFLNFCRGSSEFPGMNALLMEQLDTESDSPLIKPLLALTSCPACKGSGLNDYANYVRINNTSLLDIYQEDATFLESFLNTIGTDDTRSIIQDLMNRLTFISKVGLSYITLGQRQDTLSDGENYRLHLAKKISINLTNIVYLFEEPLSGLHPQDLPTIVQLLKELVANNNTVIATDRSCSLIPHADHAIFLGPGSGPQGGFLMDSDTEVCPSVDLHANVPQTEVCPKAPLSISKANHTRGSDRTLKVNLSIHHIQNLKVSAPLHALVAIGGVSGSGKTSLLLEGFKKQAELLIAKGTTTFSDLVVIDSHPIASSQRSDISTYFDIAPSLRAFYASLTQAKALNISSTMFSTNTKQGQCSDCQGLGYQWIDRAFYALEKRPCPTCSGFRIQPLAQEVLYEGKHFGELLHTPIETVALRFPFIKKIQKPLKALLDIGLGYLPIGQKLSSLSVSEKTALKTAYFLYQTPETPTLFLIDELFSSLDPIKKQHLPEKLRSLINSGHSVIYIDHDVKLLKSADYLIEIGPGSGKQGGKLLFSGSPKDIYASKDSLLKKYICNEELDS
ncbi:excinuclease ABC chain A [Chlamydia pneumoniae TW-183]|uniref:UvrABC system protein A n=2 Tax=Chlamydia pneumoniae TaxID=83558 RepID=UVRA_CHLPN|nr:excinuclease ABC subunit UvrA [Chlamydia pneumoniae]Q9Z985.1 RecName: Full=UvrABC system protein A; Short=UvrA protein; AltName: Full=Excinuclease ABC subunit A [Chlamydia pneumoniae]AAD18249.1 Excinuclease ABC Subunit A [Chlamydia pneumoniae CWL029]AAF38489.1 excinuclease ABC, subunit A [Chlamydia pneumoniae AR39]AAP98029.1 excinuclease ABC chain A [Chlamydia pneumoniae TW-183]CRI32593.1 UvrABC system protein A [Chlamydia pneumoniae]CRI35454.1 UvrABC system protein A [Chlamydia pneumoniae